MDIQLLTQADMVLSHCGRPTFPSGTSVVYITKGFLIQNVFSAATSTPLQTVTLEVTGDADWCLRRMQVSSQTTPALTAIDLQVLLPNGRFLVNNLIDALQIAGFGSYGFLFTKELKCPPGSKIQVTFQVTDTTHAQPTAILFDGAYSYIIKSSTPQICATDEAAQGLPRYYNNPNQNIMAPCWQQGVGPATPPGFVDEEFYYASSATAISVTAANVTGTQQIAIESGSEFHIRRVLVLITPDGTVTAGSLLARIRDGSGYAFTDDYIDIATYIGSAPLPKDWVIAPGDSVFIDGQLVDQAGTGNFTYQTFLEGFKRRAA